MCSIWFTDFKFRFAFFFFSRYCTEILASLPFTCPDEPLYLIYDINRVIQLRAGGLEANMKAWSSVRITNAVENLEDATSVQQTCEQNLPTQVNLDDACGIPDEDLQKFQVTLISAVISVTLAMLDLRLVQ